MGVERSVLVRVIASHSRLRQRGVGVFVGQGQCHRNGCLVCSVIFLVKMKMKGML